MLRKQFILLAFCALGLAPLQAGASKYLPDQKPDVLALLAPPPVVGSSEEAADLESAFRVYSAAAPEERTRAAGEATLTIFHFSGAIGPWFVPGKFPKTEALFAQVEAETKTVTSLAKKHWARLRPYHVDPARFPAAIEHEPATDYGYPSGHSTRGTTFALLLVELFPEKRESLLAKACDTGWLRVEGGVHYPTDIYAGRVLGQALVREFLNNLKFVQDLEAARAELALRKADVPLGKL